jgi:hypothetical protein
MGWLDDIDRVEMGIARLPHLPVGQGVYTLERIYEKKFFGGGVGAIAELSRDGQVYARVIKPNDRFPDYAKRDIKALCAALVGIDPGAEPERAKTEVTGVVVASILSAAQPCKGVQIQATVIGTGRVDKNGQEYTNVRWSPVLGVPAVTEKLFPPPGWEAHPADPTLYINKAEKRMLSADELRKL